MAGEAQLLHDADQEALCLPNATAEAVLQGCLAAATSANPAEMFSILHTTKNDENGEVITTMYDCEDRCTAVMMVHLFHTLLDEFPGLTHGQLLCHLCLTMYAAPSTQGVVADRAPHAMLVVFHALVSLFRLPMLLSSPSLNDFALGAGSKNVLCRLRWEAPSLPRALTA
jgi:hypothetical protein